MVRIPCIRCLCYENLWGNLTEWLDGITLPNTPTSEMYKFLISMPDGSTRKVKSVTVSGNYVKSVYHQKYMDVISVSGIAGTSTTFYADVQHISNASNVAVFRSYYSASNPGGISCIYALYEHSYASTYTGTRLAFRGKIEIIEDVDTYKSLKAIY